MTYFMPCVHKNWDKQCIHCWAKDQRKIDDEMPESVKQELRDDHIAGDYEPPTPSDYEEYLAMGGDPDMPMTAESEVL